MPTDPIHNLPAHYRETEHLILTEGRLLLLLNLLALIPLALAVVAMDAWWQALITLRGPGPQGEVPWWIGLPLVLSVLLIHELIHAAAIRLVGHRPRIGAKWDKGVLYATADGAFFRRGEFILVALAPLVVITVVGMALMVFVSQSAAWYIGLAVAINGGGAIGDVWMTVAALRHPPSALVKDEEDGIRIYDRAV